MSLPRATPLHYLEYALARLGLAAFDLLPVTASLIGAKHIGTIIYYLLYNRRRLAIRNLLLTKVAQTPKEARRIAKASFQHFAMLAVESLYLADRITPQTFHQYIDLEICDSARHVIDTPGTGVIVVSGHLGNWEVAGSAVSFHKPMAAIARSMDNPLAQRLMLQRDSRQNITVVDKNAANPFSLIRALKQGKLLAILVDQYNFDHAINSPFLGVVTQTVVSPARLHLATHCPLIVGVGVRTGKLKFKFICDEPPLTYAPTGDKEADVRRITDELNVQLERYIRRYPEQYLWMHRRWR